MAEDAGGAPRADQSVTPSPSSPVRSERRRRDKVQTRSDILTAAAERFSHTGYSHVTLKEIADDVGVTPAMVVRYFGSKMALFEEVAGNRPLWLPPLSDGDLRAGLEERARAIVAYFADQTARASGVALLRSLDLDDGRLFRTELEKRILEPWRGEIVGDQDGELRVRLIAGLLMGVGMFSVGALIEPNREPLTPAEAERLAHYLAAMLAVCVDP